MGFDILGRLKEQDKMIQENKRLIEEQNALFKQMVVELQEIKRILSEHKEGGKTYG